MLCDHDLVDGVDPTKSDDLQSDDGVHQSGGEMGNDDEEYAVLKIVYRSFEGYDDAQIRSDHGRLTPTGEPSQTICDYDDHEPETVDHYSHYLCVVASLFHSL